MNRVILIIILSVLNFFACKEPYYPDLHDVDKLLVVEGFLSDESDVVKVRLSKTSSFLSKEIIPVTGATLYLTDDLGRYFSFAEKITGYYESVWFWPEYGRTYTLFITTRDGKDYRSIPQKLMPVSDLEPFMHVIKTKSMQVPNNGELITKDIPGIEFSINQQQNAIESPYFRYSSNILVEYTEKFTLLADPISFPELFNCWKHYSPNQYFKVNNVLLAATEQHKLILAFCPIDGDYLGVTYKEDWSSGMPPPVLISITDQKFYCFAITVKKYHISHELHQFYQEINKQLEASNRIFDPISFQIKGNMICIDNYDEPVLGVFEVASTSVKTYAFSDFQIDGSIDVEEIQPIDIESLPLFGRMYASYPYFWIYKN